MRKDARADLSRQPNLVAQQGILLEVEGERVELLDGETFESRPVGYVPNLEEAHRVDHQLVRITLPWASAIQLLTTLRAQEIYTAMALSRAATRREFSVDECGSCRRSFGNGEECAS